MMLDSVKKALDGLAAKLSGTDDRPADLRVDRVAMSPLFQALWDEIAEALRTGRKQITPDCIAYPNLLEVHMSEAGHRREFEEVADLFDVSKHSALDAIADRFGYPQAAVTMNISVADPTQLELADDEVSVEAYRVPDPAMNRDFRRGSLKTTITFGYGAKGAAPQTHPVARPSSPWAHLSWTDDEGAQEFEVLSSVVFGRDGDVLYAMDPSKPEHDGAVIPRKALRFDLDPDSLAARVTNLGKFEIKLVAKGRSSLLVPRTPMLLPMVGELVWPGLSNAQGVRMSVRAPRDGAAILSDGQQRQHVVLRKPRSEVTASPSLFGANEIRFRVDLSDHEESVHIANLGVAELMDGKTTVVRGHEHTFRLKAGHVLTAGDVTIQIERGTRS